MLLRAIVLGAAAAALGAPGLACGSRAAQTTGSSTVATTTATVSLRAAITGPGHAPKVNAKWHYVVRVTSAGRPAAAKLTMNIVDPVGGVHPVQFGPSTKVIRSWPIDGSFRDYLIFPPDSRGIPLVVRATLRTATGKAVAHYRVVPR